MVGSPRLARISRMLSSIGHAIGANGLIRLMVVSLKWRLLRVASWAWCAREMPAIRVSRRSTGRPYVLRCAANWAACCAARSSSCAIRPWINSAISRLIASSSLRRRLASG